MSGQKPAGNRRNRVTGQPLFVIRSEYTCHRSGVLLLLKANAQHEIISSKSFARPQPGAGPKRGRCQPKISARV
jgi:hypothetical protein